MSNSHPPRWRGLGRPSGPDFFPVAFRRSTPTEPQRAVVPTVLDVPSEDAERQPEPEVAAAPARRRRGISTVSALVLALLMGAIGGGAVTWAWERQDDDVEITQQAPRGKIGPDAQEEAASKILPAVVQVDTGKASGSGFVFDDAGYVMTNHHVVVGEKTVRLKLQDGKTVSARVLGSDAGDDIAVLQVDDKDGLEVAEMGQSKELKIGQPVLAIGSPLGLSGTVTAGIVSAVERDAKVGGQTGSMVQTDASINPGNSGGPLVNDDGQVVGVNTSIATAGGGGGNIGIGFAVPIDRALQVAKTIIE